MPCWSCWPLRSLALLMNGLLAVLFCVSRALLIKRRKKTPQDAVSLLRDDYLSWVL
ncbi:sortase B protein-sorting domain-containing protein [Herbaspirillum sp. 1173]|uniref:sortase B protein-sorting domain-containing protein n=1 Tax=Herbaspirillum sp. 1173 TaxID=2817734 RepID=UPI0038D4E492